MDLFTHKKILAIIISIIVSIIIGGTLLIINYEFEEIPRGLLIFGYIILSYPLLLLILFIIFVIVVIIFLIVQLLCIDCCCQDRIKDYDNFIENERDIESK